MTAQSNAAAERSAHVTRGQVEAVETQPPMVQLPDGSWKLRVLVEAEAEIERLREALSFYAQCGDDYGERARAALEPRR